MEESAFTNYVVAVIVETPKGLPLVKDTTKPAPHFWKFPGGRNQTGEMPEQTAVRELTEETSIQLGENQLKLVHQEDRRGKNSNHTFFVFQSKISQAPELASDSKSGEATAYFEKEKIRTMPDFFPNHLALLDLIK